jgi:hypothetical protein
MFCIKLIRNDVKPQLFQFEYLNKGKVYKCATQTDDRTRFVVIGEDVFYINENIIAEASSAWKTKMFFETNETIVIKIGENE